MHAHNGWPLTVCLMFLMRLESYIYEGHMSKEGVNCIVFLGAERELSSFLGT